MTNRVRSLLKFHNARSFGSKQNLVAEQRHAREVYGELTLAEQYELAELAIKEGNDLDEVLCCLACFQPGSLAPFQRTLVHRRMLYPGVIFHGAKPEIASDLLEILAS
jgi:hypothetical protein